mgnify:CR=1 FL=1
MSEWIFDLTDVPRGRIEERINAKGNPYRVFIQTTVWAANKDGKVQRQRSMNTGANKTNYVPVWLRWMRVFPWWMRRSMARRWRRIAHIRANWAEFIVTGRIGDDKTS